MALVLGPGGAQNLHSRKAQCEALLWEDVVWCSRKWPLLIIPPRLQQEELL